MLCTLRENDGQFMLDDEIPDDTPRTADEIARRAIALLCVIACACGDAKDQVTAWLKCESLWDELSPKEASFLDGRHSEQDRKNMTWRVEAAVPLLWAIQKIDTMPPLATQCETAPLVKVMVFPPAPTKDFVRTARLRPADEISDEYERVYESHWRVRDAQIHGKPLPEDVDPGVVAERHHGFNWLIGYMGQAWDDISTDT